MLFLQDLRQYYETEFDSMDNACDNLFSTYNFSILSANYELKYKCLCKETVLKIIEATVLNRLCALDTMIQTEKHKVNSV